ncbi:MAG: hypothetical protein J0H14_05785 [Alphaproteobacteria bacterium]|nr:hypothetical protein [Alphaproteobacteria bacterium]
MRIAIQQQTFTPAMTQAGITASNVKKVGPVLVTAINNAYTDVVNRGPAYRRWFGGMAANWGVVMANMTTMRDFANGAATVTLVVKATSQVGANSNAYAWGQGNRSSIGQYILNLGSSFGIPYSGNQVQLTHNTTQGQCLQTISHELSHLVFGANINPPTPTAYTTEHYLDDALDLAGNDPVWASYNADNYGYFIEACS